MSAAFRDSFLPSFSFFDLFCTVSLSYVSSNAHRNPATGWWAFGCIVIITVTRYNEDTSRAANKTRDARLLLARGRLSTKSRTGEGEERDLERVWANLLSRRNNETFPLETLNDFRVTRRRITRTGIVGDQTGIVSVEIG